MLFLPVIIIASRLAGRLVAQRKVQLSQTANHDELIISSARGFLAGLPSILHGTRNGSSVPLLVQHLQVLLLVVQ